MIRTTSVLGLLVAALPCPMTSADWDCTESGVFIIDNRVSNCDESSVFTIDNRDTQGPRVAFPDGTPLVGVEVWAYRIVDGNVVRLDEPTITDADGYALRPTPFGDPYYSGVRLGLLAEFMYSDPGVAFDAGDPETYPQPIVNYPDNDPFRPQTQGRLVGNEPIQVPYPVVLQGGLFGGLGSWQKLPRYLRADPAIWPIDPDDPDGYRSKQYDDEKKLPAFITFTMPSNDEEEWGFQDGLPMSHLKHDRNIEILHDAITQRLPDEALADIVPNAQQRENLPIHLCGKSMGGIVTRGWMHDNAGQSPQVERYVSFDGVHGATTFFGVGGAAPGFAEWYMNGVNPIPLLAPWPRGWNYGKTLPTSSRYLLLSADYDLVVFPNCSALGVGRTMEVPFTLVSNGHKGRFIGGYEWHVNDVGHLGCTEDPDTMYGATRFLTWGTEPEGAEMSGGAYDCEELALRTDESAARYQTELATGDQPSAIEFVKLDTNLSIEVSAYVEGIEAGFDYRDAGGQSLIPPDPEITDFDGARMIRFTVENPPAGTTTLVVTRGTEDATASVGIQFSNERILNLVLPVEAAFPSVPVTISANLEEDDGTVIVGTAGSADVTVTLPDESQESLTLYDDGYHDDGAAGDGVFANSFTATDLGGRYLVAASGQMTHSGQTTQRSAVGMFIVDTSPATLGEVTEEAIDTDENGSIDYIEISTLVTIDENGSYQLMASLLDDGGELIVSSHELFESTAAPESYTATLRFHAADLVLHGVNGPWTVSPIELLDDDQALVVDTLPDHVTVAYDLADFEPPDAPSILRAVPNFGPQDGGNVIIIEGDNLSNVTAVAIGGQDVADFTVLSDTAIEALVPPSPVPGSMRVAIELTTPWHQITEPEAYWYEAWMLGDLDCDGDVDFDDIDPFVLALSGQAAYEAAYPGCNWMNADCDGDGDVDFDDIDAFVGLLSGG